MVEENNNQIQNKNTTSNSVYGLNIAALVLGIVSIILWCVWFISVPCSILALIFGIIGAIKPGKGMAIAGIITSAISLAIWILLFVTAFTYGFIQGFSEGISDEYNYRNTYSTYRYY